MSPLPKTPAYGDAAKLQQQATGLKKTNGTYGPVIQRNPAGRPTGTGGTPAPRESQSAPLPEGFEGSVRELAQGEAMRSGWGAVLDYWEGVYAESPTPFVQSMRDMAAHMTEQQDNQFTLSAARVYNTTPNQEA